MLRKGTNKKLLNYYNSEGSETAPPKVVGDGILPSFKTDWDTIKQNMVHTGEKHGDFEIVLMPLPSNGYICNFPFEVDDKGNKKVYSEKHSKAKKNVFGCCSPDKINLFRASFIGNFYNKQFGVIDIYAFMKELEFIVNGEMLIDRIQLHDFCKAFLELVVSEKHKAEEEASFLDHFKGGEVQPVEEVRTVIPESPPATYKFAYEAEMEALEEARKKLAEEEAYFMSLTCSLNNPPTSLQEEQPAAVSLQPPEEQQHFDAPLPDEQPQYDDVPMPAEEPAKPPPPIAVQQENNNIAPVDKVQVPLPLKEAPMTNPTVPAPSKKKEKEKEKEKQPASVPVASEDSKSDFYDLLKYVMCSTADQVSATELLHKDFIADVEMDIDAADLRMLKSLKAHKAKFNVPAVKSILKKKPNGTQLSLWMEINGV
jgi:hypothetical protein